MNEITLKSMNFDMAKINTMLAASEDARNIAEMTVIQDEETYKFVSDELMKVKAAAKAAEKDRKEYTKPLDDLKKKIMDAYRPINKNYDAAESIIKKSLQTFAVARERERQRKIREYEEALRRQEEAKRQKEEAERLRAEAAKAEDAAIVDEKTVEEPEPIPEPAPVPVPPVAIKPAKKLEGATIVKTKKARVVDVVEFLKFVVANPMFLECVEIKESVLNKIAVSAGDSVSISGVEIYEDVSIAAR